MKMFLRIPVVKKMWGSLAPFVLAFSLIAGLCSCAFFKSKEEPGVQEQRGHTIVSLDCGKCHGEQLQGDGPHHSQLRPEPTNLTLVRNTKTMIVSIVHHGVPGTGMPPIPAPESIIDSVLAYLVEQPKDTSTQWDTPWGINKDIGPDRELGRALFTTFCTGCHGANADGNGYWGMDSRIRPRPANLHAQNSDMGRLYSIISNGREGTMMPPQKDVLNEKARWDLSGYVASVFDTKSTAEIQRPEKGPKKLKNPQGKGGKDVRKAGSDTYDLYCAGCHGDQGKGSFQAPRLTDRDWKYGNGTDTDVFVVIEKGIPGKLMPSNAALKEDQRWEVISWLRHRGGLPHPMAK